MLGIRIGGNHSSGLLGRIEENLLAPSIELALDMLLVCSMGAFHVWYPVALWELHEYRDNWVSERVMCKAMIGLNNPVLQFDGKYEFFMNFLEKGDQRLKIWCNIWDKGRPAEIRLDGDNFEGAWLHYSTLGKHFGGFEFVRLVIQEADSKEDVEK